MKYLTYLVYIIFWQSMIWGGAWYAVFVLNQSGWWFVLAVFVAASAYRPTAWIYGIDSRAAQPQGGE